MKELMLGNKAFARGLYEAGVEVVSSYPGTPSTEVTEEAAKYDEIYCEWAPNEKVAMEVAFGACLAGKRSFCGMKHVGMNVAADPKREEIKAFYQEFMQMLQNYLRQYTM